MTYDVFISHASEDREEVARPLAERLRALGLKVWLDEFELTVGDSLRQVIDHGLSQSRFGVVILSPHFFEKDWPLQELDGLAAKEQGGQKVILPVWHKITKDEVLARSPMLAGRLAAPTARGIEHVAQGILRAVRNRPPPPPPHAKPPSPAASPPGGGRAEGGKGRPVKLSPPSKKRRPLWWLAAALVAVSVSFLISQLIPTSPGADSNNSVNPDTGAPVLDKDNKLVGLVLGRGINGTAVAPIEPILKAYNVVPIFAGVSRRSGPAAGDHP